MSIGTLSPLKYVAGDSILLEFTVTDQDGAAAIITGDTIAFAVVKHAGDTPVITTEGGSPTATGTITDGAGGIFQVSVLAADTVGLGGLYQWDAELTDATGGVQTVARGTMLFVGDVV